MKKGEKFKRIKIIKEEYNQLKKAENEINSTKIYKRIQAFKLIYKNWNYSDIAEFLNITIDTMTDWINLYKKEGIKGLLTLNYKGGQQKLNKDQLIELRKKASEGNFTFAKDIQNYIKNEFKVEYNIRHVQLISKKKFVYPLNKLN